MQKGLTRWLPLICILLGIGAVFYFHLYELLTLPTLKQYHQQIILWTTQHYWLAVFYFCAVYIITIALSIPGATVLTLASGFIFGIVMGTILVVISATLGASVVFFATHTAFRETLMARAGPWLKRFAQELQTNAVSYLLFVRLIPIFPFWLINIVAGLLNVRFIVFFLTTLIGIMPASLIYVAIGSGLHEIFAVNKAVDFHIIFKANILLPLVGLAVLAVVPVFYQKIRRRSK